MTTMGDSKKQVDRDSFPDIFYHFKCLIFFITSEHYNSVDHCYAIAIGSIPIKGAGVDSPMQRFNES